MRVCPLAGLGEELHLLPAVEQKITNLSQSVGDDSGVINHEHTLKSLRDRESRAVTHIGQVFDGVLQRVEGLKDQIGKRALSAVASDMLDGPNGSAINGIAERVTHCDRVVDDLIGRIAIQILRRP